MSKKMLDHRGGGEQALFARVLNAEPANPRVWAVVALLVVLAGLGDVVWGPYVVLSTVYLLPVAVAAWYLGRGPGLVVAIGCSVVNVAAVAVDPGAVSAGTNLANGGLRLVGLCLAAAVVSALHRMLRQVRELAGTDELTGLVNRRRFFEAGDREFARARRDRTPVAVACIDIDDLKAFNDLEGHAAGDDCLRQFATIGAATLRATDILARTGGDEFSLLLPGAELTAARATVDRLVADLGDAGPRSIGVSVGICAGRPDDELDLEGAMTLADHLMYEAKRAGKGRVCAVGSLSWPDPLSDGEDAASAGIDLRDRARTELGDPRDGAT